MTTITDLKVGDKAKIKRLEKGGDAYRQKLLALGLTPNTEFVVNRVAPLGDPVEIAVRGFHLSLRKREAVILDVEKIA